MRHQKTTLHLLIKFTSLTPFLTLFIFTLTIGCTSECTTLSVSKQVNKLSFPETINGEKSSSTLNYNLQTLLVKTTDTPQH